MTSQKEIYLKRIQLQILQQSIFDVVCASQSFGNFTTSHRFSPAAASVQTLSETKFIDTRAPETVFIALRGCVCLRVKKLRA
jgi:hypothetical protein